MLRKFLPKYLAVLTFLFLFLPVCSFAQAGPSAYVHRHSIYVGGEYALWNSDYFGDNKSLNKSAFAVFGDYTVWNGSWPVSLEVNYTKAVSHENDQRYLSSFLSGIKVGHRMGRWQPFAKAGAGLIHFTANDILSYHQDGEHFGIGVGGGLEYRLTSHITLRPVDYTYMRCNFYPHALSPQSIGFGVSYRIH